MTKELDIFNDNKQIQSFGGRSLAQNMTSAELAITDMADDFRIHNHSNTQFAWGRFVLQHKGGLRNIRQITAEINKKSMALSEAKHRYAKQRIEIKLMTRHKNEISKTEQILDRQAIECNIAELEDQMAMGLPAIEGAIKDILTLKKAYDQIMEKYDGYTEADLENEEIDYWIRRMFSQGLRDLREFGSITKGEQEAIEQMGFNVSLVKHELTDYLRKEENSKDSTSKPLNDFLDSCVKKYHDQVAAFAGFGGFTGDIVEESVYSAPTELKDAG